MIHTKFSSCCGWVTCLTIDIWINRENKVIVQDIEELWITSIADKRKDTTKTGIQLNWTMSASTEKWRTMGQRHGTHDFGRPIMRDTSYAAPHVAGLENQETFDTRTSGNETGVLINNRIAIMLQNCRTVSRHQCKSDAFSITGISMNARSMSNMENHTELYGCRKDEDHEKKRY